MTLLLEETSGNDRAVSARLFTQKTFATFFRSLHLKARAMTNEISLDKLIAGDRAEFARLVDTYSSSVYRLGLKMLGNPQDAEDVLQNTFLNALLHLPNFEGRSSITTWLYRIAANEALIRRRFPPEFSALSGSVFQSGLRPHTHDTVFQRCDQRHPSAGKFGRLGKIRGS